MTLSAPESGDDDNFTRQSRGCRASCRRAWESENMDTRCLAHKGCIYQGKWGGMGITKNDACDEKLS